MQDNIFALSSGLHNAAIALIRISGSNILETVKKKFAIKKNLEARNSVYTPIYDPLDKQLLDQVIITYFAYNNSFTGEEMIEISMHASRYLVSRVLDILAEIPNYRLATAGEFSKRAFLNGKINLLQAEAINDLLKSETRMQARQAMNSLEGNVKDIYANIRMDLLKTISNIEACIDFPEDDIPDSIKQENYNHILKIINIITKYLKDKHVGEIICDGIKIVIIGPPNVGKSSLLNYYAKRDVSIVSNIPGTTRDVIEIMVDYKGYPIKFHDTAGLRKIDDKVENIAIEKAKNLAKKANVKLIIFDYNNIDFILNNSDQKLVDDKTILVYNKNDSMVLDPIVKQKILHKFAKEVTSISIKKEYNLDMILSKIIDKAIGAETNDVPPIITRKRHRKLLEESLNILNSLSFNKNIELIAEDLRIASLKIGELTGEINTEEILDKIFSNFCIGK